MKVKSGELTTQISSQTIEILEEEKDLVPDEIWVAIFSNLSCPDYQACRLTCKKWKQIFAGYLNVIAFSHFITWVDSKIHWQLWNQYEAHLSKEDKTIKNIFSISLDINQYKEVFLTSHVSSPAICWRYGKVNELLKIPLYQNENVSTLKKILSNRDFPPLTLYKVKEISEPSPPPKHRRRIQKIKDQIIKPKKSIEEMDFAIFILLDTHSQTQRVSSSLVGSSYILKIRKIIQFELQILKNDIPQVYIESIKKVLSHFNKWLSSPGQTHQLISMQMK